MISFDIFIKYLIENKNDRRIIWHWFYKIIDHPGILKLCINLDIDTFKTSEDQYSRRVSQINYNA